MLLAITPPLTVPPQPLSSLLVSALVGSAV